MFYVGIVQTNTSEYSDTGSVIAKCLTVDNYFYVPFVWRLLLQDYEYTPTGEYSLYIAQSDQVLGSEEDGEWKVPAELKPYLHSTTKYLVCMRKSGTAYAMKGTGLDIDIADNKYDKMLEILNMADDVPKYAVVFNSATPGFCLEFSDKITEMLRYVPYIGESAYIAFLKDNTIPVTPVIHLSEGELGVVYDSDVEAIQFVCKLSWNAKESTYEYVGIPWFDYMGKCLEVEDEDSNLA